MQNWKMSAQTLFGGTPVKYAQNGDGTGFADKNRFWAVGLEGTLPTLPGEGSMTFDQMVPFMDSPKPTPLGRNILTVLSGLMDSPLQIPLMSTDNGSLGVMRSLMDSPLQISFMSPRTNSLDIMRSLMDGPFHNNIYTSNNNPVDFLRGFMDPAPVDFYGMTPIEYISAVGSGRLIPKLPLTPIERAANNFRPVMQPFPGTSAIEPLRQFNDAFNRSMLANG